MRSARLEEIQTRRKRRRFHSTNNNRNNNGGNGSPQVPLHYSNNKSNKAIVFGVDFGVDSFLVLSTTFNIFEICLTRERREEMRSLLSSLNFHGGKTKLESVRWPQTLFHVQLFKHTIATEIRMQQPTSLPLASFSTCCELKNKV
jgi:hypothetical protein